VKTIGGMEYHYALRGDGQEPTRLVSAARQRRALELVLSVLDPAALDLDDDVLALLAPRPAGEARGVETFSSATWPAFDLPGAAEAAAAAVLDGLLQPERLARMLEFHRRDEAMPGVDELLDRLIEHAFVRPRVRAGRAAEIARLVETVAVQRLIGVAAQETVRPTLRERIEAALARIRDLPAPDRDPREEAAHAAYLRAWITRFLERPSVPAGAPWSPPAMPPGSPIGAD
jgi:hypothetical protein